MTRRQPTIATAPKMFAAQAFVAAHPGTNMLAVAEHVGPNGSRRFGYAIVHRAITAGLIDAYKENGRYTLFALIS